MAGTREATGHDEERARWEAFALWLEAQPHRAAMRAAIPTRFYGLLSDTAPARARRKALGVVYAHKRAWHLHPQWRDNLLRWGHGRPSAPGSDDAIRQR